MKSYEQKLRWKQWLLLIAVLIGIFSLWYTDRLVQKLAHEEDKKVIIWANATRQLLKAENDFNFLLDIIRDNETIPVILVDDGGNIIDSRNLDSTKTSNDKYMAQQLQSMKEEHQPIPILYDEENGKYNYLYYRNSIILTQLKRYPYYQLSIIGVFIAVAYFAFSSSRKAEQNQVWVGMSKETAHQLGTPISSLNGWIQLIRETGKEAQEELLNELENDVKRLERITERFSKIGSAPELNQENVEAVLKNCIAYLRPRTSGRVKFSLSSANPECTALVNVPLFEWVIENLCKNAIDAMEAEGNLDISVQEKAERVWVDITDTGKGIPASKHKTVFKPGFTTKKRGWGLGLSLAKRIIEDYHKGSIYVQSSEPGKGTTFRIELMS
jgi:two-component sensor histidine kinase